MTDTDKLIETMLGALCTAAERYSLIGFEESDNEYEREEAAEITRAIDAAHEHLGSRDVPASQRTALRIRHDVKARPGQIVDVRDDVEGVVGWLVLAVGRLGSSLEIEMHDGEIAQDTAARFERLAGGRSAADILRSGDLRGVG